MARAAFKNRKTTGQRKAAKNRPGSLKQTILRDHKRNLTPHIKLLKQQDGKLNAKRMAYRRFAEALKSHADAEERAIYKRCLEKKVLEMRTQEGFVEHQLASLMMDAISQTELTDTSRWLAQVQVLAELVEHHIEEEEEEFLDEVTEAFDEEDLQAMTRAFLSFRGLEESGELLTA